MSIGTGRTPIPDVGDFRIVRLVIPWAPDPPNGSVRYRFSFPRERLGPFVGHRGMSRSQRGDLVAINVPKSIPEGLNSSRDGFPWPRICWSAHGMSFRKGGRRPKWTLDFSGMSWRDPAGFGRIPAIRWVPADDGRRDSDGESVPEWATTLHTEPSLAVCGGSVIGVPEGGFPGWGVGSPGSGSCFNPSGIPES